MPSCATAQAALLNKDNVGPANFRQMIGDTATDYAASNNQNTGFAW
tara:strand:- start:466 stop:603 length:138 start_codon:yes stop_codon:yes gene_type:complete